MRLRHQSMAETYDVIVIGGGIMGLFAAYRLSQAGQHVLLLEQYTLGHKRGSSHGQSRVIRYVYDYPIYIDLAREAYAAWQQFEEQAGEPLLIKTGGLYFGSPTNQELQRYLNCTRQQAVPHEMLTVAEATARYPQFQFSNSFFDRGVDILYQADTGFLKASDCLHACARLARDQGVVIRDNTRVTHIDATSADVSVRDHRGVHYSAARLVMAAGPWSAALGPGLRLKIPVLPKRMQYGSFRAKVAGAAYRVGQFPIFIAFLENPECSIHYGIPDHNGLGVKIAADAGTLVDSLSKVDFVPDTHLSDRLHALNKCYLPELHQTMLPNTGQVCLYSLTPDRHFIIDKHPQRRIKISTPKSHNCFKRCRWSSSLDHVVICCLIHQDRVAVFAFVFVIRSNAEKPWPYIRFS